MCYHRRSVFSQRTDNDDDHEAAESEVNIFGQRERKGERESGGLVKEPGGVKYALVECKFKNQSEGDKEDEVAQNEIKGMSSGGEGSFWICGGMQYCQCSRGP